MSIVMNVPCPECQHMGHDAKGTNMIVFSDGVKFCNRAHWHKDGQVLLIPADGESPILNMEVTGTIKYTQSQFEELVREGKLDNPTIREIALSGMKGVDRWAVANQDERDRLIEERNGDESYFNQLKVKNLVSRHIPGNVAKFYNVRVGLGLDGKVARHYYPTYDYHDGEWKGAKCRTLPKDFKYGSLGWTWGDNLMFGQKQTAAAMESGARMDTLLLVGGECDVLAAQTMMLEAKVGSKWEGVYEHVWSPTKGEMAIEEIILNKDEINKFKKVLVCFDDDEVGKKLNRDVGRIFRTKVKQLKLPAGCKDPNDALKQGRGKEFMDAWWNPADLFEGGYLNSMDKYREKAKKVPTMGLSWPWELMNKVTYGIRDYTMSVWGMGTGVGKTTLTKEVVFFLAYTFNIQLVVIYLEERADKTVRSFAGYLINKNLNAPPCNDKDDPDYEELRDYTEEEANEAIDRLCNDNRIYIGDLEGRKDVSSVMQVLEEASALGFTKFVVDNLTAFEHKGENGKAVSKVEAIDETMKRLGTFKDENPISIFLLSHLKKVYGDRTPFEEGGDVTLNDFRGAGSIVFWADDVWAGIRNTTAPTLSERCLLILKNLKTREVGHMTGTKVYTKKNMSTGKLEQTEDRPPVQDGFDDGVNKKRKQPKQYGEDNDSY